MEASTATPPSRGRFELGTWAALAALIALRVAIPLAVLAASGSRLPSLPPYEYNALPGDAHGFYSAAREFIASWGRLPPIVVAVIALALAAVAVWIARSWRPRPRLRPWLVVAGALAVSLAVTIAVTEMSDRTGAAVFGWPLIWSVPMLPYRALGLPLDPDVAFGFGLAIALPALAVTVVAIWLLALRASGRRDVALLAAGSFSVFPLVSGFLSGDHGGMNGSWFADSGLCLCTEPVSSALVAVALALLLAATLSPLVLAFAGVLLSVATTVRLSNGLVVALALILLVARIGPRRSIPFLAGALTFVPVVAAWWPRGYAALFGRPDVWPSDPFSFDYVISNWTDSLFFSPVAALVLVPLAALGGLALGWRWAALLLGGLVASQAAFYSLYANTAQHPRFLLVALPALLTLWSVGAVRVGSSVARVVRRGRARWLIGNSGAAG